MSLKRIGLLPLLLVFAPVALLIPNRPGNETWILVASCLAIIPFAGLMGKATEHLSERLGPGVGGLLNASFGNAAELIIAVFALRKGLVDIVKASLTGSILGNILLVLGLSIFAGGLKRPRQTFNATAAGVATTMLALAATGMIIPAVFHAHLLVHHAAANELGVSLEIAVVLFCTYLLLLLFSLKTHRHLYDAGSHVVPDSAPPVAESTEEPVVPHWSMKKAATVLTLATVGVSVMSERLVSVIEAASHSLGWTPVFVGVIVVAVIGNAAEHSTAILVAMKDRMELAFQIAVGSGVQIALFVAPLLVFISWLPGFQPLDLIFTTLEVVSVVISVIVVALVARDGESNWIEGLMLLAVYVILAIAFYHLPAEHA